MWQETSWRLQTRQVDYTKRNSIITHLHAVCVRHAVCLRQDTLTSTACASVAVDQYLYVLVDTRYPIHTSLVVRQYDRHAVMKT